MIVTDCIDEYFELMKKRPELFEHSEIYPLVTDRAIISEYEKQTGKQVGVLYKSQFNTLVVDLIKTKDGYYTYERIIPTANCRGVVCIPVIDCKLLLVHQYRHPIRHSQLCFPRGFGENNISSADNARKELREEIGADVHECVLLGSVTADSGLIGAECDVYICYTDSIGTLSLDEGIADAVLLTEHEIDERIKAREITDGFTLSAYSLYKART